MNELELAFPGLRASGYAITSPVDPEYNCLAWAATDDTRWWWPDPLGLSYWPPGVPREESMASFRAAYAEVGFVTATDESFETGLEKVAVYAISGSPTHAARQLPNGRWTSKLGVSEDIEHDLVGLLGTIYGAVELLLVRPRG